jgi:hypothetical protein
VHRTIHRFSPFQNPTQPNTLPPSSPSHTHTPPNHEERLEQRADDARNGHGGNAVDEPRRARAGAGNGATSHGTRLSGARGAGRGHADADERLAGRRDGGDDVLVDGGAADLGAPRGGALAGKSPVFGAGAAYETTMEAMEQPQDWMALTSPTVQAATPPLLVSLFWQLM